MISKNKISQIRKLHAKKFRDESGLFLVEGYKSVEMLCDSDFAVEEIFATENALRDNDSWLKDRAITMVSVEEMSRISTMQTPPELLAIAQQRTTLPEIPGDQPVLVLDHIPLRAEVQSPENVLFAVARRKHEDLCARHLAHYVLQRLDSVHNWHSHIQQQYIRPDARYEIARTLAAGMLSCELEVRLE